MFPRRLVCALPIVLACLAISLGAAPTITTQPASIIVTAGSPATLAVAATGTGTLTYQWRRNGFAVAGATAASYSVASATRAAADFYDVVVTDSTGTVASSQAHLSVAPTSYPNAVARDAAWDALTETIGGTGNVVLPIPADTAAAPGGSYVGGTFTTVNGVSQTMLMRLTAAGAVDSTFTPPALDGVVTAVALQPDGRVLVGGGFQRVAGGLAHSFLVRLMASGAVDPSFSANVTSTVNAIVVQADGQIIIGGVFTTVNGVSMNRIARLNPDGTTDSSFAIGTGFGSTVNALVLLPDGRLVVSGGFTSYNGVTTGVNRLARLFTTVTPGSLDTTLNIGSGPDNSVLAIAVQAKDGAILLGGSFRNYNGTAAGGFARISSTGALDTAYNANLGVGVSNNVNTIALQGDSSSTIGSALIGGNFSTLAGVSRPNFWRITSTGAPDTVVPAAPSSTVNGVAVQADGRIVIAGSFTTLGGSTNPRHVVGRLNADLTLDTSALVFTRTASSTVAAVLPQSDGKVVVAGNFAFIRGAAVPANLARFNSDGSLDASFNAGTSIKTIYVTNPGSGYTSAPSVVITGSGTGAVATATVVGGFITSVSVTSGGSGFTSAPTISFSGGGGSGAVAVANIGGTGANNTISAASLLPDGRIAIGGNFTSYNSTIRTRVAVIKADGTLDPAFNAGGAVGSVTVTSGGAGYTSVPLVSFTAPPSGGTAPVATATISNGSVTTITLNSPGSGYTSVPTVTLTGGGATTPATAVATLLNGVSAQVFTLLPMRPATPGGQPRLFLGGSFTSANAVTRNRVAMFNLDGSLDTTFSSAGTGADNNSVLASALQPDGKIVIGGSFTSYGGTARAEIARITESGALDTTFLASGTGFSSSSQVNALAVLTGPTANAGQIVAVGNFTSYNGTSVNSAARLSTTGALDTTFVPTSVGTLLGLLAQEDGRVILRGTFTAINNVATAGVMRIATANGARDTAFVATGFSTTGTNWAPIAMLDDGRFFTGNNATGLAASMPATTPVITAPPVNQTASVGGTATFSVTASSPTPLTYQWLFNGAPLSGGTDASYTVTNAQAANVGRYSVVVTNELGSTTTSEATLSGTNPPPVITQQPQDVAAVTGMSATMSVTASGTGPLTYQWRRGGVTIVGATNASYSVANTSRTDADSYDVRVCDGLSVTESQAAKLTVAPNPYPQAQLLDPAFAPLFEATGSPNAINKIVLAPGNKFIAAGEFRSVSTTIGGNTATAVLSRVARFNADGSLDTTFAPTAVGTYPLLAAAVQTVGANAGKVVIANSISVVVNGTDSNDTRRIMRLNADGTLDVAFNSFGRGVTGGAVNAMVTQPDDKFIAVGAFTLVNDFTRNRIVRFNADGSLDNTFFADVNGTINSVALQADGKVLIGGTFTSVDGQTRNRVARLNADGSLDMGFNPVVGGVAPAGPNSTVNAIGVALDGSNKIYIGGAFTSYNGNTVTRFARLNTDGSFDAGVATFNSTVFDIACFANGSVVVGGNFSTVNGSSTFTSGGVTVSVRDLVRLTSTGAIDATLNIGTGTSSTAGLNGQVLTLAANATDGTLLFGGSFTSINGTTHAPLARLNLTTGAVDANVNATFKAYATPSTLAAAPGGQLLVGGNFFAVNGTPRFNLARISATTGALDAAYNPGTTTAASINGTVNSLVVRGDGKAIIAGAFTAIGGTTANRIARLNAADGSLDSSFVTGTGLNNNPTFVLRQPDGKIIVGGGNMTFTYNGVSRNGLVRLLADGGLDTAFAPPAFNNVVNAAALQPDGRIVVVGSFTTVGGTTENNVARLNATDGSLDTTFNVGAGPTTATALSAPQAVAVQPDGLILIGGDFTNVAGVARSRIARLNANGTLNSFVPSDGGPTSTVNGFLLQENGGILVRGTFSTSSSAGFSNTFTTIRYLADGTRDTTMIAEALGNATGFVVLDDGTLVTIGSTFQNFADYRRSIAHFLPAQAISITSQPQSLAVNGGQPATFAVTATGASPKYQWLKDGDTIYGATTSTYTIAAADPILHGSAGYSVQVSNLFGTVTSATAVLTVNAPPLVTAMPRDVTVDPQGTVTLVASIASSQQPVTYQWKKDGAVIAGATNASYTIPSVQPGDAGSYTVVASNGSGTSVSTDAALIGSWLFTNAFAANSTGVITFLADGRYTMAEDGNSTADPTGQDGMERGTYSWNSSNEAFAVKVYKETNGGWGLSALGSGATLSLAGDTLTLTNGSTVTTLTRVVPVAGNPIVGAWHIDDPLTVATFLADGRYFLAEDGDPEDDNSGRPGMEYGTYVLNATTGAVTVNVITDTNGEWGLSHPFGGTNYARVVNDTLVFSDAKDYVAAERVKPLQTVVAVSAKPTIANAPVAASVSLGNSTTLSVTAGGTGPFTYQWRKNGAPISGATATTFTLPNIASGDLGLYDVVITNAAGSTATQPVTVGLDSPFLDRSFYPPLLAIPAAGLYSTALNDGSLLHWNNQTLSTLQRVRTVPLIRYLADGTRDGVFDANFPSDYEYVGTGAVAATTDGKFYASLGVSHYSPASPDRNVLARFFNNGTLDPSFTPYEYDQTADGEIRGILPLADGKVLATGFFRNFNGTGRGGIVRFNSNGTLDTTFAVTTLGGTSGGVWCKPAIDANGKIVICGDFPSVNGTNLTGVARLNADGTLDASFVPFGYSRSAAIRGVIIQSTGRIVLGGRFSVGGVSNIPFIRLKTDGALDTTFEMPPFDPIDGHSVSIRAMTALDNDRFAGVSTGFFVRNAEGSPDGAFAPPMFANASGNTPELFGLSRLTDGTFAFSGEFDLVNGLQRPNLAKVDATGAVLPFTAEMLGRQNFPVRMVRTNSGRVLALAATSIAPNGLVEFDATGSPTATPFSATLANAGTLTWIGRGGADGRVLALAEDASGATVFRRVLADGAADPALTTTTAPSGFAANYALVQPDGKTLLSLVSPTDQQTVNGEGFKRLNFDGSVDTSFSADLSGAPAPIRGTPLAGETVGPLQTVTELRIEPLAIDGSGRIYLRYVVDGGLVRLGRLNADGSRDTTFPVVTTPSLGSSSTVTVKDPLRPSAGDVSVTIKQGARRELLGVAVQASGKVVVVGHFASLTIDGTTVALPGIARFNTDGTLDSSFATGAGAQWTMTPIASGFTPGVDAMIQQADGRLLLAGNFEAWDGVTARGMVRLNSDGTRDTTFVSPVERRLGNGLYSELHLQNDGSVLVHGGFTVVGERYPRGMLRLFTGGPSIQAAPSSVAVVAGGSATFSVSATGPAPLSYQWRKGGADLAGATNATFTVASVTKTDAGSYDVVVSSPAGNVTSPAATLTVNYAPTFTTAPANQTAAEGATATFSSVTDASPAATYQWSRNGQSIAGATAASYTTPALTFATNNGDVYAVVATNSVGTATASATLTVTPAAPAGATIVATFGSGLPVDASNLLVASVTSGSLPLSYQWARDGSAIPGATASSYLIRNGGGVDSGRYTVTVSNSVGANTSPAAVLGFSPELGWVSRSPVISGASFSSALFANGRFLVGGTRGALFSSADGTTWTSRSAPTVSNLFSLAYGNGMYVAYGSLGALFTSTDGENWIARDSQIPIDSTTLNAGGVTFGNGRFVIVFNRGSTSVSTDGITWTPGSFAVAGQVGAPSFLNGKFHVTGTGVFYASTDGQSWTPTALPTTQSMNQVGFGAGRYVAVGDNGTILTSTDGSNWSATSSGSTQSLRNVAFVNNLFVVTGATGGIYTSTDGITWTSRTSGFSGLLGAAVFGNGVYVMANNAINGGILKSTDGATWVQPPTVVTTNNLTGAATDGGNIIVAVSQTGPILSTTNAGVTFTKGTFSGNIVTTGNYTDVAYGAGVFIAVGNSGLVSGSPDGVAWGSRTSGTTALLRGVKFGNAQFVAVGANGTILTSGDGTAWSARVSGVTASLANTAYGAGVHVVVGSGGTILTSSDGIAWTQRASGVTASFNDVVFANNQFVAVGAGVAVTSSDGTTWTNRTFTADTLRAVIYGGGNYLATVSTAANAATPSTYWTSSNGIDWTPRYTGAQSAWADMVATPTCIMAVGNAGTIAVAGVPVLSTPESQAVAGGSTVIFRSSVAGAPAGAAYQWQKKAQGGTAFSDIPGANSPSLTLVNVGLGDNGEYRLLATTTFGTATSGAATLTALSPPVITTQPVAAQTVLAPQPVTLSVVATGSPAPQYQWKKNGDPIAAATDANFTIPVTSAADSGTYTVTVSNAAGTVTSSPSTLTVQESVFIVSQPQSQTVVDGEPAAFSVTATGGPALAYQWNRDGVAIVGATAGTYVLPIVSPADNGAIFTVTVTNAVNSVTSNPATLTVQYAPTVTVNPADPIVLKDQSVTFTAVAAGNPAPALQWSKNGTAIAGATTATLTISAAQLADEGTYSISATNTRGAAAASSLLTVNYAPVISVQPADVVGTLGGTATFTVTASAKPAPTYQWRKDGNALTGATDAVLTLSNLSAAAAGAYTVVVTNSVASVTSTAAALTFNASLADFSPTSATVGSAVTLNGAGFAGATAVKFNGVNATSFTVVSDAQITAVVPLYATTGPITITTAGGSTLSSATPLTVLQGPRITSGSARASVGAGENAVLASLSIEGTAAKPMLIRAVGPGLVPLGVSGAISDPQITLHDASGAVVAWNDNWGGSSAIANAATAVGAFALSSTSKDAALLISLLPGTYTARVTGVGGATGEVLVEAYETGNTGRAAYLSTRARSSSSLVTGFTVGGSGTSGSQTLLIRAVGAGLGTTGALANPTLSVMSGSTAIATNDNWATFADQPALAAATAAVGAMPLAANDSALLVTLAAGAYTVQVDGGAGIALTEIFVVDGYRDAASAPALLAPLQDQTLVAGNGVTFAAPYTGKPATVSFQWFKNGTALPGATGQTYAIASATSADAGDYSVALANSTATTTSAIATVGVNTAPAITAQPVAQTVIVGQTATFAVTATAFPDPTYQWRRNGLNIAGANASTLTIAGVSFDSGGYFDVVVSNTVGSVTSAAATLTVNPLAPNITSALTATGVLGRTFSYQINANTTQATYSAAALPSGLVLDTATGAISGVPTTTGSYNVTLTAQNISGSNTKTLQLAVLPPPPIINSAASSTARVGTVFSFTILAVNSPTSFGASGLPSGLTLDQASGVISGTPTQAGTFAVTLSATNGTGTTTSQFVLTVEPALNAPVYSGTTLLSGVQNSAFNFTPTFNTSGLTTTYSATGLPTGVAIDAGTGAISGTPTVTGTLTASVTATNSGGSTTVQFTFTVNPPPSAPTITSASLASATVGVPFSFTVTTSNSATNFSATGLPALGLSLNSATGVISGTPTAPGTLSLQVRAANAVGTGPNAALVLTINPSPNAPVIDSASALGGRVGDAFNATLHASNSPTSFAISSGALPAGLTLNTTTGIISGTPSQVGSFAAWIAAANVNGPGYALQVTFTIAPALTTPVVNSNGSAAGQVGQPFSYQITASNSPTSFATSGLPAGLTLNAATGVVSGIPSEATAAPLSVLLTASNASGTSLPKTLSLSIAPAPATPIITSPLSVTAQVGTAFSYQITASDNATSFLALNLPPGVTLNATSGAITGVPSSSGTFAVSLRASNAAGLGAASTLAISIAPTASAPGITSPAAATGKVGNNFSYTITTNGTATSFGLTGALPLGLSLNTSTGVISGNPAASGVFTVQLTATGSGGTSLPQSLVLNIAPADNAPVITSPIYASATVGQSFVYQITASSSPAFPASPFPAPYTLDAINLPAGLGVNPSTGLIQGQPTTAGVFTAALVGTNAAGTGPARELTIFIAPAPNAPTVTSSPYAAGQVGAGFSYAITGTNTPSSFDVLGAPAWMTTNNVTGSLAGTPTAPGTYTVQLLALNAAGPSNPLTLTITIVPSANAPVVTSPRTASGTVSATFAYQITAAVPSGAPPVTSYVATGLPAGLSLNATTGAIGGTPTQSGQFEVTLIGHNAAGDSQPVTLILTINPNLQFNGGS